MKKIVFGLIMFAVVVAVAGTVYAGIVLDENLGKAQQEESSSNSSSSNQDTSTVDLSDKSSDTCYSPSLENKK
ncbi:MAG: hypothetical protein PHE61_05255 [Candidatus Omnitrophica bacterium]|nr:hypothetical protein [Candidatus Omnitrophota bacterium]